MAKDSDFAFKRPVTDQVPAPTPRPGYGTEGMSSVEMANYRTLKSSPKGFSDDEARYYATNPSGRLGGTP